MLDGFSRLFGYSRVKYDYLAARPCERDSMLFTRHLFVGLGALGFLQTGVVAQTITANYSTPNIDRWMYPFNSSPGAEASVSVFAALNQTGFDDRDAQFLLGWTTSTEIPTGRGARGYRVVSATVRAFVSAGDRWTYDNTYDSVRTAYLTTDPEYLPDSDAGAPVELWAVGYRGGFSLTTFNENSGYANVAPFPPQEGVRNCYSAGVDIVGNASDVSRQVEFRFDATPFAVGQISSLSPGALVPEGAEVAFALNTADAAMQAYVARSLSAGRLQFMISTLSPASGGPGGGTGTPTYPAFYTKENALSSALGYQPKLDLVVQLTDPGDYNGDGGVDGDDIIAYFADWDASNPAADFNFDGGVDGDDVIAFFTEWDNG